MKSIILRIVTAVLTVVSPAVLSAQDAVNELCGLSADDLYEVLAPQLAGVWASRNGAGVMTGIGAPLILRPQSELFTHTISLAGGAFSVQTEKGEFPMDFYDGNLNFNPPDAVAAAGGSDLGVVSAFDNEDLLMTQGCDVNDLPKVHIFGSFFEPGGEV